MVVTRRKLLKRFLREVVRPPTIAVRKGTIVRVPKGGLRIGRARIFLRRGGVVRVVVEPPKRRRRR